MKTLKHLIAAAALLPMLTACIDGETENAGFSRVATTMPYANNTDGAIMFATYGNWHITQNSGNDWCHLQTMEGQANMIYQIPFTIGQNTTGAAREANFTLQDNGNGDVKVNFIVPQHATRGDGTLGNAATVKRIEGSDGSLITADYDSQYRPTALTMEKNGTLVRSLEISYSDNADSTITVFAKRATLPNGTTLTAKYGTGYQPTTLTSDTDTVGYYDQGYIGGSATVFNVEEHFQGGEYTVQALKLTNKPDKELSFAADGTHNADSLRYRHKYADGNIVEAMLELHYSKRDNRRQSLDINQLLLGIEECNPYTLVSLYKFARNSSVISEAKSKELLLTVETTENADGSINTMTVTRTPLEGDDRTPSSVTYTFGY